jgi:hypothetical protein
MSYTINIIDGEKGGVGKSWFAFSVSEYLRAKLIKFYLYAADQSNPTATSRYKDKERYAKFYEDCVHYVKFSEDVRKIDDPDILIEMASERTIVIDLPAQIHRPLTNWIEEKDIFILSKENNISWVRWFVCNGEDDSINILIQSAEFYKDQTTVLVRNEGLCHEDEWEYFDKHQELQATIKKYKMIVINFPKLSDKKRIKLNANRWTFEEMIDEGNLGKVGISDIQKYVKKVAKALDSTQLLTGDKLNVI